VVAVHLSHHDPVDLAERLAVLGAEVLADGSVLHVGSAAPTHGRRLLVTGGARSGKSALAEAVASTRHEVQYVATAPSFPDDAEWAARVRAHRERRPAHWALHETLDLAGVLRAASPGSVVLVDCLALWVTGLVDRAGAWQEPGRARSLVGEHLAELADALGRTPADVVLVTNEVGAGVVPATASGRLFQDLLGRVNITLAATCDDVALVTCGLPRMLKGTPWTTST
jgi:adenosylcobinamide kinase/adenosylcobinamide-phosphate guanylyltransferase